MHAKHLLHHLVESAAARDPARIAVVAGDRQLRYQELEAALHAFAGGLAGLGLARAERVGIYLDKRPEFVAAAFGTSAAGGVFVPINPVLKAAQVGHILRDCAVRVLVTTAERLAALGDALDHCHDLRHVVLVGADGATTRSVAVHSWQALLAAPARAGHRVIDADMAAIKAFYAPFKGRNASQFHAD